ncbi:hypothetical protein FPOA_12952 [Fusarium poae]|uniref:RNase III domain-containing protein n=1 Tax=Fusarium poae TaxID=36050 RepID=A0A1B8A7F0_FUSPO|nr:hypothetical protein FPOA_12952 [Fusarium poae]
MIELDWILGTLASTSNISATKFQRDYVDQRPVYVFHKTELGTAPPTFSATVTLPSALPRHLRRCQGGGGWRSEKNAMKEAAFRAFVALYQEGLVSDHLLPLNADSKEEEEEETQLTEPELLFNPWQDVVQKWQTAADKWLYAYEFFDHEKTPFHYVKTIPSKPPREQVQHPFNEYEDAPEETYLVVEQWTRRSDLLHELRPGQSGSSCTKPYRWVLPISRATVDEIPRRAVKCAMLIPCIIHELEVQLIASELSSTLLAPVGIADLQLVIEAISSRSAAEPVDYERLEFLGDSVLKFCTVTQVYSEHPFWPEGLLNHFKDRLFILAKTFTGVKWRPLYRDDFLDVKPVDGTSRFIGPKTLADVVEALVGASYQDGGMHKSLKCIKVFLGSKCNWHDDGVARDILFRAAPSDMQLPPAMEPLEELIGYTFKKKSLLVEAMTHGSYVADGQQRSYEQLEFLGMRFLTILS